MSQEINYVEEQKRIGDENTQALKRQGGHFRSTLRLAFDTNIRQYCANERISSDASFLQEDGPWAGVLSTASQTVSAQARYPEELNVIYALCELGRRGDAEILDLPIVTAEMREHRVRHGHYHGIERLDFDVPYIPFPIRCGRMKFVMTRIVKQEPATDSCERDVGDYRPLLAHVSGKKQVNDVQAFIQADMADVDGFIWLDGGFLRAFGQIEERLGRCGISSRPMTPKGFAARPASGGSLSRSRIRGRLGGASPPER